MNTIPNTTIAITDDHKLFRSGLAALLSHMQGLSVSIQAEHGQELLDKLNQAEHIPDIILLDISMPVMNGYETMVNLNQQYPDIKVLVISMHTDEYPVIKMLSAGACGYLSKNTDPGEMAKVIKFVSEHGYYYQGLATEHLPHGIAHVKAQLPEITPKEMSFLLLCSIDNTYEQIAVEMNVSKRTVENYRDSLFKKLDIHSRLGLAVFAIRAGLVINQNV